LPLSKIDFFAVDGDVNRRLDSKQDTVAFGAVDDDPDLGADPEGFVRTTVSGLPTTLLTTTDGQPRDWEFLRLIALRTS
jgi:hypothetical protein